MYFTCNLSSWDIDNKSFSNSFSPTVVSLIISIKSTLCKK